MNARTEARGTWGQLLTGRHLGVAAVLAGGEALYAINVYLTSSLLPTAIVDIGGLRYYAWTSTVFLIASVFSSMIVSRTLAARGPRGAYLIGLALFASGTAVCAMSPTMEVLLVGRALQGFGGGLLAGLGYAVINSALPRHLWTRATALVSTMWGVGTLVGPAVGGVFAQFGAWRWAFGTLIVCTVAVAVLVPIVLPPRTGERDSVVPPVPVVPLALLIAATLLVSVAGLSADAATAGVAVAGATALVVWFVAADRRSPHGVLPPSTFTRSALRWVYLTIAVLATTSTVETFIPLFGQQLAGMTPVLAGFLGAALALGWTVGEIPSASAAAPRVVRRIVRSGPLLVAAGLAIVAVTLAEQSGSARVAVWAAGLIIAGAGIGVAWPHLAVGAMNAATGPAEGARASAAINTVQLIANAFGTALAGVLVNLGGQSEMRSAQLLLFGFAALALVGGWTAWRAAPRDARANRPNRRAAEVTAG
ncbi:MFS transporter [Prescottella agglutinans]|uniref:MFS transporter n=1 Tax=Prescottella agglutinans TaxID=1644129 RepID=UPI003D97783C